MPKQTEMTGPGVEAIPGIPELDELAKHYVVARDERMEKTPREVETKKALIQGIHDYAKEGKLPRHPRSDTVTYKNGDVVVELIPQKEKLRVRAADSSSAPEDKENEE